MQPESSAIREQLVHDFLPVDVCPMGAQFFTEAPGQIYQSGTEDKKSPDEVINLHSVSFYLFIYFLKRRTQCAVASFTFNG